MKLLGYSLAVFFAVALTYLPSVRYEFLTYDDHEYVFRNEHVMSGMTGESFLWAVKSCGYASNWHPLTWMSLQLDASLVPGRPPVAKGKPVAAHQPLSSVMHAHNVVLHAANATLLFLLVVVMLKRLDPDGNVALPIVALFALMWAIHPLRTEVVCWVSERKELLSVFFMLLTMLAFIGREVQEKSPRLYFLSLLFFALALAAKPVAVTLPVVLFAWDWVMSKKRFGKALLASVPYLLMSAGACALTLAAQVKARDVGAQYTFVERVVMSLCAPVIYLKQTFCPLGLSAFYPSKPPVPWIELGLGVILLAGAVAICFIWLFRRRSTVVSLLAFSVAWCLVSLVPMLGIVKVGDQPHSDRYTYWVGCGLVAIAALAICRYVKGHDDELMKVLAFPVAVLALLTWMRMPVWKNMTALCLDGIPKSWNPQAVCAYADILCEQGEEGMRRAEALLREALSENPDVDVAGEFALLLACKAKPVGTSDLLGGKEPAYEEARFEANAVLRNDPAHPLGREAIAIIDMKEGKWEEAINHLEVARKRSKCVDRVEEYLEHCKTKVGQARSTRH